MAAKPAKPGQAPVAIVVMGVSGAGKSTVGQRLAEALGTAFIEGDRFHPPANIEKMSAGIPLTDEDRRPWLARVGEEIARAVQHGHPVVCACSSLKRLYRDILRASSGLDPVFVYLEGPKELIAERTSRRRGHFFPASLVESQFEALEPPGEGENHIVADLTVPMGKMVAQVARKLVERLPALAERTGDAVFRPPAGRSR